MPDMILRCIDLETTGMEPPAYPIEAGFCDFVLMDGGRPACGTPRSWFMNPRPGEKIPSAAKAVHHITDADLASARTRDEALAEFAIEFNDEDKNVRALVAHQAKFERQWLAALSQKDWICTWKVACTKFPDLEAHSLQFLRYELDLDSVAGFLKDHLSPAHRAGPDAFACALLVWRFVEAGISVDDMVSISKRPCLLPRVTFGKHVGQKWHDVPSSYLDWCTKNIKDDEDVEHTARYWLRIKGKG